MAEKDGRRSWVMVNRALMLKLGLRSWLKAWDSNTIMH
jgi:hypothetical protein